MPKQKSPACPLIPLADRLIAAAEEETQRGLVILVSDNPTYRACVVAVGPGKLWPSGRVPIDGLVPGDRIAYKKFIATDVEVDGVHWLILREDDVLAKFAP